MAGAPALIDNSTKRVEQIRDAMNFIQYDQTVLKLTEKITGSTSFSRSCLASKSR
jgi:hypothetical protein